MDLFARLRAAFAVGDTTDPLGRSLVVEQFRILRKQVPVLYAVLLIAANRSPRTVPAPVGSVAPFENGRCHAGAGAP
jgi:hypothetical protein